MKTLSLNWEDILPRLSKEIANASPEIKNRETVMIVRTRSQGIRLEFFSDEATAISWMNNPQSWREGEVVCVGSFNLDDFTHIVENKSLIMF